MLFATTGVLAGPLCDDRDGTTNDGAFAFVVVVACIGPMYTWWMQMLSCCAYKYAYYYNEYFRPELRPPLLLLLLLVLAEDDEVNDKVVDGGTGGGGCLDRKGWASGDAAEPGDRNPDTESVEYVCMYACMVSM